MAAIFNTPVSTIIFQYVFGTGHIGSFAVKSISSYFCFFAAFCKVSDTFHHEYLSHVREIKVSIQIGGCQDVSGFNIE